MNEVLLSVTRKDIFASRDKALAKLKHHKERADYYNSLCCKLERQLSCKHNNMKQGLQGGAFGGVDTEICEDCGYEWDY